LDIQIENKATVQAGAGGNPRSGAGVRIKGGANLDAERITGTLTAELFSGDSVAKIEANPEDLERAGMLVQALRRKVGDLRDLCLDHGYYESKRPHYDCPVCGDNAKPEAAPAPAVKLAEPPAPEPF
jgi:hypothetical protein